MRKFFLTVLGIAIYILVGWLIKDIVFANYANPLDTSIADMMKHEALIYCILAAGYAFIIQCFISSDDNEIGDIFTYWIVRCGLFLIDIIIYINRTHHCI